MGKLHDPELEAWLDSIDENWSPEQWADSALAAARVKHTRRKFLHPHITQAIRDAQTAAVRKALKP